MQAARRILIAGLALLLVGTAVTATLAATGGTAGTAGTSDSPLQRVPGLERITAVAASGDVYAALRTDGSVWVWDRRADPQAREWQKVDNSTCSVRDIAAGAGRLALVCADGTVWTAGIAIKEQGVRKAEQVQGLESIKAVSMGRTDLVALGMGGKVWVAEMAINTKGTGAAGRLVPDLSGVTSVAAGIDDFVAVMADGTAVRRAINTKGTGTTLRYDGLPPVRAVAACGGDIDCDGKDPFVFATADGKLLAAGTTAAGTTRAVAVGDLDGDGYFTAGHRRVLWVAGSGNGRYTLFLPDGKPVGIDIKKPGPPLTQVAAGAFEDLWLAADGTVWRGIITTKPNTVGGLSNITAIASGGDWHVALAANHKLFCWGSTDRMAHEVAHVVQQVAHIAAAADFFVTLNTDGSVAAGVCPAPGAKPAEPAVQKGLTARAIAAGDHRVLMIKPDGHVAVAGIAIKEQGVRFGEAQAVAGLDGAVQAAATETGYLVLTADGTVWGALWGKAPVQVTDVAGAMAVAGGDAYTVALGDGSVRQIAIDEQGVHVWGDPHVSDSIAACCSGGGGGGGSGGAILLRADGTVVADGEVIDIADVVAVSGTRTEIVALKADGTVWRRRRGNANLLQEM